MTINLQKYFERIGYKGSVDVSIETLKGIHAAQMFSIPFENLSIHELPNASNPGTIISLDEDAIFKKLVTDKRGGYCHENNELLALVLKQLGFQVDRLAARVLTAPNLPRGHKLLLVTIDAQQWIADVGFGGSGLFEPIPLIANQESNQYGDRFKLVLEDKQYIFQIFINEAWKNLYEFTLEIFKPSDFESMNYYVSHHPDSIFVKNRVCVIPTPAGRIILNNLNLKIMHNGKETLISLKDDATYFDILKKYFGIALHESTQLKPITTKSNLSASQNVPLEISHQANSWYNFFAKSLNTIGITSASFYAKKMS